MQVRNIYPQPYHAGVNSAATFNDLAALRVSEQPALRHRFVIAWEIPVSELGPLPKPMMKAEPKPEATSEPTPKPSKHTLRNASRQPSPCTCTAQPSTPWRVYRSRRRGEP